MTGGFVRRTKRMFDTFGPEGVLWALKNLILKTPFPVTVPGDRGPIYLRAGCSDFIVFEQVYVDEEYGVSLPPDLETIVDLGANIGLASRWLAMHHPQAAIVCVEPDSRNYEILCRNLAPFESAILLHAAAWNDDVMVDIPNAGADFSAIQVVASAAGRVQGITLPSLMAKAGIEHIDLLKIDIEGAEVEFLQNAEQWISHVSILIIELHDRIRPGCRDALLNAINTRKHELVERGESTIVYFE